MTLTAGFSPGNNSLYRKMCFFNKPLRKDLGQNLSVTLLEMLLEQKSQDYGSNIQKRAKRNLKTLYEVYLPVLMVQLDSP